MITEKQIKTKREVGTLDGKPVTYVQTIGGFHMVGVHKGGSFEVLGTGPHRGVAYFIAKKKTGDAIKWSELSKSDHLDIRDFEFLLPQYEALTDHLGDLLKNLE